MEDIECVKKDLFNPYDVIEIGNNEGYVVKDGKSIFGTRIGPIHSVRDGLLHEIAHTAEVKNLAKFNVYNFGLEIKTKVVVLGREYAEPITWNATKLECRVILWQEMLCEKFNIAFDREDFAIALQYMPDFTQVPLKGYTFDGDKCGYFNEKGEEFKESLKEKEKDKLRFQSMYDYMTEEKNKGTYTYAEFKKKWSRMVIYLKNPVTK